MALVCLYGVTTLIEANVFPLSHVTTTKNLPHLRTRDSFAIAGVIVNLGDGGMA